MLRISLLLLFLFSCGFTIITEGMIEEREQLCDRIRSRYTEAALTSFVNELKTDYASFEGASISESTLEEDWTTLDWNPFWHTVSGDWAMKVIEEKKLWRTSIDGFEMLWAFEEDAGIFVSGHRDKSGALVLDKIFKDEIVHLNWM